MTAIATAITPLPTSQPGRRDGTVLSICGVLRFLGWVWRGTIGSLRRTLRPQIGSHVSPRQLVAVRAWPWVLAMLVLAPTLRPGYLLSYDMVFVPDLAMRSDFLGLGTALPRAVPFDALVAVLDEALSGMLLQKVVLVAALVLAGIGARRLVAGGSTVAQLAATSLYVWNPFVAERLLIGHWPVLLAYAALPWIMDDARRLRAGQRRLPSLTLWLPLAATSASGGITAGVVALAFGSAGVVNATARRGTAWVLLAVLATNAPWLVTGLLHASDALSDPRGGAVFAAGAEGSLAERKQWAGKQVWRSSASGSSSWWRRCSRSSTPTTSSP